MPADGDPAGDDRPQLVGLAARRAASLLDAAGMDRVLLVSDPAHSLRIEGIAEELGLDRVHVADRRAPRPSVAWPRRRPASALARVIGWDRVEQLTG